MNHLTQTITTSVRRKVRRLDVRLHRGCAEAVRDAEQRRRFMLAASLGMLEGVVRSYLGGRSDRGDVEWILACVSSEIVGDVLDIEDALRGAR